MAGLRAVAASYWTALVLGVVAIMLHVRWYTVDKAPGPEVVSGLGAALVVLGVFVGARPYIRAGVGALIQAGLPVYRGVFPRARGAAERHRAYVEEVRPQVTRDVWAERVVAVVVVVLGTLLNGYGPLIARVLHLRAT